eukprot:scaffold39717_cov73-Phaeocystis_antarctica.AAC.3
MSTLWSACAFSQSDGQRDGDFRPAPRRGQKHFGRCADRECWPLLSVPGAIVVDGLVTVEIVSSLIPLLYGANATGRR